MNIDHAPRIRAQQRRAEESEVIKELAARAAPMLLSVCLAAIILGLGLANDASGHLMSGYIAIAADIADKAAQAEALVQCMNGQAFSLGDEGILRCHVTKYNLVLKP